jgi:phosphoesterase RecJ-like protein
MLDVSVDSLFDALNKSRYKGVVKSKPCIIIDHHNVEVTIDYASVVCSQPAVATAEVLFELSEQLGWKIDIPSIKALLCGILSDSLGLTSEGTTARSVEIVAELVKRGGSIAELENKRRNLMKKSPELVHYKGKLLQRVEYYHENQIAVISIPWEEIEKYSHEYNPSVLVIDDVRQTTNTAVVIAFKSYPDGKITAKIRCNYGFGIANELAKKFGGGGHPYASGFKIDHGSSLDKIIKDCIDHANTLLEGLEQNENL